VQAIAVQSDGKILAAGGSGSIYHGQNFTVFRLLPTGQLDDTFNGMGAATVNFGEYVHHNLRSITIGEKGSITIVGELQGPVLGLAFANFSSSGSLNLDYGDSGKKVLRSDQAFLNLAEIMQPKDGSLIGAGQYYYNTNSDYLLLKVDANGQPDAAFGNNGLKTGYFPGKSSFLSLPKSFSNGDLLSKYVAPGPEKTEGLIRLHPDGTEDQTLLVSL
jgi:uncharacterized delta-60 repeat protein